MTVKMLQARRDSCRGAEVIYTDFCKLSTLYMYKYLSIYIGLCAFMDSDQLLHHILFFQSVGDTCNTVVN